MNIYFLSGLGADERAFSKLILPESFKITHIPWAPVKGDESIATYAKNLCLKIDTTRPFILAGLSFGGLVAAEICKFIHPEMLILFSTVKAMNELPLVYRLAGRWHLYRYIPKALLPMTKPFLMWFFGPLDKGSRALVDDYLRNTDFIMLRWALGQISRWENTEVYKRTVQIHGSRDRAFPSELIKADYYIRSAGHFCVYTHAKEINLILKKELAAVS